MTNTETTLKCEDCGLYKPDVQECTCPFELEIREEVVAITVCDDCYEDRRTNV